MGDEPFQLKCMKRIRQFQQEGRTIIFVTHSFDLVRQLCDRVFMLEQGSCWWTAAAQEATRMFRERNAADLESEETANATGDVTITDVKLTDGQGDRKDRFEPGDDLGVLITLEAPEKVDGPVVGVAIHNHVDSLVYGTDTAVRHFDVGAFQGERRVRFLFEAIPMVEGQYFVSVTVESSDKSIRYHQVDHQAAFKVFSGVEDTGMIHLEPRIAVDD